MAAQRPFGQQFRSNRIVRGKDTLDINVQVHFEKCNQGWLRSSLDFNARKCFASGWTVFNAKTVCRVNG
jgi:hypothetical protein